MRFLRTPSHPAWRAGLQSIATTTLVVTTIVALAVTIVVAGAPIEQIAASWHPPGEGHAACGGWAQIATDSAHESHSESQFELAHGSQHSHHGMLSSATGFDTPSDDAGWAGVTMPPRLLVVERHAAARSVEQSRRRGRAPPRA